MKARDESVSELRPAILHIWDRKDDVNHMLLFEDHNDAVDVWQALKSQHRYNLEEMISPEVYKKGEKPDWLPLQPKLME